MTQTKSPEAPTSGPKCSTPSASGERTTPRGVSSIALRIWFAAHDPMTVRYYKIELDVATAFRANTVGGAMSTLHEQFQEGDRGCRRAVPLTSCPGVTA